jgi:hypothetical protein
LPDVPTVAESGYPDYEVDQWFGLWAPAKTPKEAVSQLAGWFNAALHTLEIKQKLVVQGLFPVGGCVARALVVIFAGNTTNTAAPSARRTSRQSESARPASGHFQTKSEARDGGIGAPGHARAPKPGLVPPSHCELASVQIGFGFWKKSPMGGVAIARHGPGDVAGWSDRRGPMIGTRLCPHSITGNLIDGSLSLDSWPTCWVGAVADHARLTGGSALCSPHWRT